ncbi:MAG: hypothetical protein ACLR9T_04280 [Thomasclavelia sp.]|uniref:hypothetical protein n=1 Tax=Thomasclavelia sp. TaxID=3025757 RepID=UPI0039A19425
MNEDYRFLESLAHFLQQGYLIQDVLEISEFIFSTSKVKGIKEKLNKGFTLDEAIIKEDFDHTFIEYFKFFRIKNNLSKAIIQSLEICKSKDTTLNKLKKELTYPTLLVIFLIMFSLFIVYALLPSIMQLFTEFTIKPDLVTKFMFKLFTVIPILVIIILFCFGTICFVSLYAIKKQYFQLIDFLVKHIWILKRMIQKYYSIKFALYYNELLINGYDSTDIIIMLYQQIDDSDIKMLIYEIYRKILLGESLEDIISQFDYFEPLFITFFKLLLHDNRSDKSLDNYLKVSLDTLHFKVIQVIKFIVPFVYCFTAGFVILVYISIVIPMMSVISTL